MSSLLAYSKLSGAINHGLVLHRIRSATKLSSSVFPATQNSLFRSAAQKQSQAGLARAPEPVYFPEHIIQGLPQNITHPPVTSKASAQTVDDTLKKSGAVKLQEITKPVIETTSSEPAIDTANVPAYHRDSKYDRAPYWQKIGRWKDITEKQFLSYRWGVSQIHTPSQVRSSC
jgi:hypothetical protein